MRKFMKGFIVFALAALMLIGTVLPALADSWDGNTGGPGGNGVGVDGSWSLLHTDYRAIIGFRFSVYKPNGTHLGNSAKKNIDVYLSKNTDSDLSYYVNANYNANDKYSIQQNKTSVELLFARKTYSSSTNTFTVQGYSDAPAYMDSYLKNTGVGRDWCVLHTDIYGC